MRKPDWRDLPDGEYRIVRVSYQEKRALLMGECLPEEGRWVKFSLAIERLEVGKIIQIYQNDFGKFFSVVND